MSFTIRALRPEDDRSTFRSGNDDLDRFFRRYAGQNQFRHHIGTTYVAVDRNDGIGAFVTVSPSQLEVIHLPRRMQKRLPRYPVPVLRVARLAASEAVRGAGLGSALLGFVLELAIRLAEDYGCAGVVVDAKNEAVAFYERFGFETLEVEQGRLGDRPAPVPMFLEIGTILKAAEQS